MALPPRFGPVSAVSIRRLLRRARFRLAAVEAVLALTGLMAAHHGMPTDMHAMRAAAVCVAVVGAGVAVAAAIGVGFPVGLAPVAERLMPPAPSSPARGVPARASPLYLRLTVLRR
jgi:hypothetical protein